MTRGRAAVAALAVSLTLPFTPPSVAALEAAPERARGVLAEGQPVPPEGSVIVGALVETPEGPTVERYEVADHQSARRLVEELQARPDVAAADVSTVLANHSIDTHDPKRGTQWALDALEAETAWDITTAEGTRIAILDSGVDGAHPDLVNVLASGFDLLDPERDGRTDTSDAGHGTRVAGVAGAEVGNGIGMAGMAKDAEIVPVRVLDDFGEGDAATIAAGVVEATKAGVDVINLSVGGTRPDDVLAEAIDRARRDGVVVVASSGNSGHRNGNPPFYPAAEPGVIAVGAAREASEPGRFERASFSSYGDWLDLVAPGERITTTCPTSLDTAECVDGYDVSSVGTSFAAPFVSATAALLRSEYPRALPSQIAWRLTDSAWELDQPAVEVGAGLVDPVAALTEHPDLGCRHHRPDTVDRSWDVGRVETAVAVACSSWPENEVGEVVLATARDFPDALAGAALATSRGMPLLLTEQRSIPSSLDEVLFQLGVRRVHLLGGEAAIDGAVQTALAESKRDIEVVRIAGDDRYATAAAIATRAAPHGADEVILASGEGFADAVAAGAFQGANPATPLLLTRGDRLPSATATALGELDAKRVVVIGGSGAVGDGVLGEVADLGLQVERIRGDDRYATSAAVVERLGAEGTLIVASGRDFPDALAAGALAGRVGGRLLLVPSDELSTSHPAARVVGSGGWERIEIVGGRGAVSSDVEATLADLLGG